MGASRSRGDGRRRKQRRVGGNWGGGVVEVMKGEWRNRTEEVDVKPWHCWFWNKKLRIREQLEDERYNFEGRISSRTKGSGWRNSSIKCLRA